MLLDFDIIYSYSHIMTLLCNISKCGFITDILLFLFLSHYHMKWIWINLTLLKFYEYGVAEFFIGGSEMFKLGTQLTNIQNDNVTL